MPDDFDICFEPEDDEENPIFFESEPEGYWASPACFNCGGELIGIFCPLCRMWYVPSGGRKLG